MKARRLATGTLCWPIPAEELAELRLLHAELRLTLGFDEFIKVPYLAGPLRRTLQARKQARAEAMARAPESFELVP